MSRPNASQITDDQLDQLYRIIAALVAPYGGDYLTGSQLHTAPVEAMRIKPGRSGGIDIDITPPTESR
jgi:hypothetical protein